MNFADDFVLPAINSRPLSSPERTYAPAVGSDPQTVTLIQRMGLLERENGILTQQMKQMEGALTTLMRVLLIRASLISLLFSVIPERRGRKGNAE